MKKVGIIKRIFALLLVFLLSINSFAAVVSDNDGSAFITKAEFDSLKNNFQAQIDQYNQSIDSKIDGAIASYLNGIKQSTTEELKSIINAEYKGIKWMGGDQFVTYSNVLPTWDLDLANRRGMALGSTGESTRYGFFYSHWKQTGSTAINKLLFLQEGNKPCFFIGTFNTTFKVAQMMFDTNYDWGDGYTSTNVVAHAGGMEKRAGVARDPAMISTSFYNYNTIEAPISSWGSVTKSTLMDNRIRTRRTTDNADSSPSTEDTSGAIPGAMPIAYGYGTMRQNTAFTWRNVYRNNTHQTNGTINIEATKTVTDKYALQIVGLPSLTGDVIHAFASDPALALPGFYGRKSVAYADMTTAEKSFQTPSFFTMRLYTKSYGGATISADSYDVTQHDQASNAWTISNCIETPFCTTLDSTTSTNWSYFYRSLSEVAPKDHDTTSTRLKIYQSVPVLHISKTGEVTIPVEFEASGTYKIWATNEPLDARSGLPTSKPTSSYDIVGGNADGSFTCTGTTASLKFDVEKDDIVYFLVSSTSSLGSATMKLPITATLTIAV